MIEKAKKDYTIIVIGVITAILILFLANSAFANGISLYEREAIVKDGKLQFQIPDRKDLPDSQKKILSWSWWDKSCISEALILLEKEFENENDPDLKAWKLFLIGTIYFEQKDFKNSITAYTKALEYVSDTSLKSATLHRLLLVHIILRDTDSALGTLDTIRNAFPNYNFYDETFTTYPHCLYDPAWLPCTDVPSIKQIVEWIPILKQIKITREKRELLSKTKLLNVIEYVQASIELGKLYEEICLDRTIFDTVCPDALRIYEEIYDPESRINGMDYALLKILQSRFAYEYEGDEIAESEDIVNLYGQFLEKFPDSPLSVDIIKEYDGAKKILENHSK